MQSPAMAPTRSLAVAPRPTTPSCATSARYITNTECGRWNNKVRIWGNFDDEIGERSIYSCLILVWFLWKCKSMVDAKITAAHNTQPDKRTHHHNIKVLLQQSGQHFVPCDGGLGGRCGRTTRCKGRRKWILENTGGNIRQFSKHLDKVIKVIQGGINCFNYSETSFSTARAERS